MKNLQFSKLNIGCGQFKKVGFINLDSDKRVNPDILWDLNKIPYPLKDESFSLITADHVLEHLNEPFRTMDELYRILKKGGILVIRVPHFSRGFTHPDHKRGFDVSFPLYFNESYKAFYCGSSLKLKKMRLNWFAQPYMKKTTLKSYQYYTGMFLGKIFNFFANLSPYLCSRIWCFWVGGFEETEYVFERK